MEKRHQLSLAPPVFILPVCILLFSSLSKPVWQSLLKEEDHSALKQWNAFLRDQLPKVTIWGHSRDAECSVQSALKQEGILIAMSCQQ